jgi:hypothetical protein
MISQKDSTEQQYYPVKYCNLIPNEDLSNTQVSDMCIACGLQKQRLQSWRQNVRRHAPFCRGHSETQAAAAEHIFAQEVSAAHFAWLAVYLVATADRVDIYKQFELL